MANQADPFRYGRVAIVAAVVVGASLYVISISGDYKPTPDSAEYMGLGRSLASGEGYQFNDRHGSYYPPLLPLLLAGIMKVVGSDGPEGIVVIGAKLVQVILAMFFSVGSYRLARRYMTERWAWLVVILVLANITVFQHCMFIVSDMLYGCLGIWALVLLGDARRWHSWIGGGVLVGLAWLTRSVGLLLVGGLLAGLVFDRYEQMTGGSRVRRGAAALVLAVVPFVVYRCLWGGGQDSSYWAYWVHASGQSGWFDIVTASLARTVPVMLRRACQGMLNIESMALPVYFAAIVFLAPVLGWWRCFRQRRSIEQWYVLAYVAALSVWFDQGVRFFLPILPLMLIYSIVGLRWLCETASGSDRRALLGRMLLTAGLAALTILPATYLLRSDDDVGVIGFLRGGYVYCLVAGLALVLLLVCRWRGRAGMLATATLLIVQVGCGWFYGACYAALEHRLVHSRAVMLAGYEPYFELGQWLKCQSQAAEPVLCSNAAIVHLASDLTTREPCSDESQTRQLLTTGRFGSAVIIDPVSQSGERVYDRPSNEPTDERGDKPANKSTDGPSNRTGVDPDGIIDCNPGNELNSKPDEESGKGFGKGFGKGSGEKSGEGINAQEDIKNRQIRRLIAADPTAFEEVTNECEPGCFRLYIFR